MKIPVNVKVSECDCTSDTWKKFQWIKIPVNVKVSECGECSSFLHGLLTLHFHETVDQFLACCAISAHHP